MVADSHDIPSPSLRLRPGDQQLPVPNDGPSMHDLVIQDVSVKGLPSRETDAILDLLVQRKQIGLDRYGSLLQALADAAVYARQGLAEIGRVDADLAEAYHHTLRALIWAHRVKGSTGGEADHG